jgi:phage major head subunit gpT-like protein
MDITRETLKSMGQAFDISFQKGLTTAKPEHAAFSATVKSNGKSSFYPFLATLGGIREWVGDRQPANVSGEALEVKNRKFEGTVAVDRDDVQDDQTGLYGLLLQDLGARAANFPGLLAAEALVAGISGTWCDGKEFFSTTRKYNKATISNKTTAALSAETYALGRSAMRQYKGHDGQPMGARPSLLVVGPKLEATAFDILKNELAVKTRTEGATPVGGAVKNAWMGSADYLVLDYLADDYDDYWFLMDASKPLKPVLIQEREAPVLTSLDKETDPDVFKRDEYLYGVRMRYAATLTLPHMVYAGIL